MTDFTNVPREVLIHRLQFIETYADIVLMQKTDPSDPYDTRKLMANSLKSFVKGAEDDSALFPEPARSGD